MTYTKLEIIFDRDHGKQNYGWYARERQEDGSQCDTALMTTWDQDPDVPDSTLIAWAMEFYCDSDGMTDAELADLRAIITITR